MAVLAFQIGVVVYNVLLFDWSIVWFVWFTDRLIDWITLLEKVTANLTAPLKLVDEAHTFCDGIGDYLTENQDFTVIGTDFRL